jgi:hypothetical protein
MYNPMKSRITVLLLFLISCLTAFANVRVKGYTRKDGTYVAPYTRSSPNSTKSDNYSTKGNVNPYTGEAGTKPGDGGSATGQTATPSPGATTGSAGSSSQPSSAPAMTKSAPVNLALITVGMSKTQVVSSVGEPNVKSDTSWFYLDRGWVKFKGDTVASVEAKK